MALAVPVADASGMILMARVLVVDDNRGILSLLREILEGHGHKVSLAANGAEALEVARQKLPDLLITDLKMPVMDGPELCRHWQADDRLRQRPIILFSAHPPRPSDQALVVDLRAERLLAKTASVKAFVRTVDEVLEQHEVQDACAPPFPDP